MGNENSEHHHGGTAVKVASAFESPKQMRKHRGPFRVGELQGQPRERQAHEAHDHADVQDPLQPGEPDELAFRNFALRHGGAPWCFPWRREFRALRLVSLPRRATPGASGKLWATRAAYACHRPRMSPGAA